jgi:hypothetical protein
MGLMLMVFSLVPGLAVPLIEAGAFSARVTIESEHDPANCAYGHDHRVCTQIGANLWHGSEPGGRSIGHVPVERVLVLELRSAADRDQESGPPARAPPRI